jgi:cytochrome P450
LSFHFILYNEKRHLLTSTTFPTCQGFIIPFLVLNTDPTVWGPDADQFIPERWLKGGSNPPADELPHGPWGNVSNFVDGPRHCVGWRLGESRYAPSLLQPPTYCVSLRYFIFTFH